MGPRLGAAPRALILALLLGGGGAGAEPKAPAAKGAKEKVARDKDAKRAEEKDAKDATALFREALAAFQAKKYEEAIAGFETAYRLAPRPEVLYALAQAERLSGDCPTAVELYHRFLDTDPAQQHADAARAGLERCEQALASRPLGAEPEPAAEPPPRPPGYGPAIPSGPAPVVRAAAPTAPPPARPRRSRWRDPMGGAVAVAGVGGLAFGGWAFQASRSDAAAASAGTYEDYGRLMDRAEKRRTWAWIGIGGGAALLTAAAVRYATMDVGGQTTATVTVEPGAVSLLAAGRF